MPRRRRLCGAALAIMLFAGALAACSGSDDDAGRAPTRTEISALLATLGNAMRARHESAFDDGATGDFADHQADVFANLAEVPLASWSYAIGPRVGDDDAQQAARTKGGTSAVIVRVSLRYALQGVDAKPTAHDLYWTFVREKDGSVAVAADDDAATAGGTSWRGPWDFGPLRVARGTSALVLAHPADAALLPTLVADVDRAVPVVTGVVGRNWSRRVAVVVAGSTAERDAALQSVAGSPANVGAVATADNQDPVSGDVLGQRVVVVPAEFRRLTTNGARLVLQHEITHVATARSTTSATPTWLTEGFADYVGYLGNGRPVRSAAAELIAQVRRDGVPAALPDSSSFGSETSTAAAYQLSWLACRRIAEQHGRAALVRFYDAVGAATVPSDEAVTDAARQVLGETPAQFTSRLRSYVSEQLGG